ncbi:MAG TPA: hypothetical protein VM537_32710 [Anaerolineae bacterium]|nr:hypothetical protein [Anaerolineae bacterium]
MNLQEAAQQTDATMGAIEAIIVSVVGRLASWIAGVPSAVLVAKSVGRIFDLTQGWAWAIAISFELIGLTTTSLWAGFREWNQNTAKRKTDPKAPEKLALAFVIAYLLVDLVMIGILTVTDFLVNRNAEIFVGITYPVMTAVSVLVMNERIKHRKRQADFAQQLEKEAKDRKEKREGAQPTAKVAKGKTKARATIADWRAIYAGLNGNRADLDAGAVAAAVEAAGFLLPSRRSLQNWVKEAKEAAQPEPAPVAQQRGAGGEEEER